MALDLPVSERIILRPSLDEWQVYAIGGKGDGIIDIQFGNSFFSFPVSTSIRKKLIIKEIVEAGDRIIIDGKGSNLEFFLQFRSKHNFKKKAFEIYSQEFYSNDTVKIEIPNAKGSILTFLRFESVSVASLELLNTGLVMGYPPIHVNESITLDLDIPLTEISYFKITGGGILDGTLVYGIVKEE